MSPEAKSFLYLLIHERTGTKERGHRLMPGRFKSSECPNCEHEETLEHRYVSCGKVSSLWQWVRAHIEKLNISMVMMADFDLLQISFYKGNRENAILWLIGIYVEIVEKEIVGKGSSISTASLSGLFKQKKLQARYQALPDIGPIYGLEWNPERIG